MTENGKKFTILIADDDEDDYLLTQKAFIGSGFTGSFERVKDGIELMALLLDHERMHGSGAGADDCRVLLLLDLNMPRKDGREALKEIKSHPRLKRLPVVVLTTSTAEADISMAYELGANSFIRKPAGFAEFVEAVACLTKYWLTVSQLPRSGWLGVKESPAGARR